MHALVYLPLARELSTRCNGNRAVLVSQKIQKIGEGGTQLTNLATVPVLALLKVSIIFLT